ncbi:hypothetical protein OSTOST_07831 [Ostertagia ostertagi]
MLLSTLTPRLVSRQCLNRIIAIRFASKGMKLDGKQTLTADPSSWLLQIRARHFSGSSLSQSSEAWRHSYKILGAKTSPRLRIVPNFRSHWCLVYNVLLRHLLLVQQG